LGNEEQVMRMRAGGSPKEGNVMKKYLVAAGLIVGFASPALAADYYVALKVGGGVV
jgi:hypothetical protein